MNKLFRIFNRKKVLLVLALVLLLSLVLAAAAAAQTGSGFDLTWHVVGSGGGRMTGGVYQVDGTVGQVAVEETSTTGRVIFQGFWQDFMHLVKSFLPVTMKH